MDAHADANRDMQKAIYDMLCERDESGGEQQTGGLGVQKEIQQVHKECSNWKNDSIKEYTTGMKYVEQAFKNMENIIPRKLEELLDSKLKNYVNNILQTTLESLMNKQAQELTKFRFLSSIQLKKIDASVKSMEKNFNQKLTDIEARIKNHEVATHTSHGRTQENILKSVNECIQTQVKRLEAQQTNIVEMNLSEALNSKEILDKLSDMNLVITENIEQSNEQIKRLDPETQLSEVRSMNKTVISNAERLIKSVHKKIDENIGGTLVETLGSLSGIIKSHCTKTDQTNDNLLLVGQDVKSIGEKCQLM